MSNSTAPTLVDPLTGLRRFLYFVTPSETSFAELEQVPKFVDESIPYFMALILAEYALLAWRGRRRSAPISDSIGSVSGGIVSQLPLLLARSIELSAYVWVHDNFRLATLPWDSAWAWAAALVGVDFCYYWVHRFAHEVNLFWSGHQMHHSSERYNLTTALRQSVLQRYFSWFFYLPLALLLPPSLFYAHTQFNLLYQFWIHTEVVDRLPWPIEFVMNTPSHHRVHHGRNPYCIDKNYAGTFIIFDRIFGTFEAERPDEPPVYGLLHPVQTLDPIELQVCHLRTVWQQVKQQNSFGNRLRALFCGPGWQPGTARLGDGQLPEIEHPVQPFDPSAPAWVTAYSSAHFLLALGAYAQLSASVGTAPVWLMALVCALIVLSLSSVARLVEKFGAGAEQAELNRCVAIGSLLALLHVHRQADAATSAAQGIFLASAGLWLLRRFRRAAAAAGDKKAT